MTKEPHLVVIRTSLNHFEAEMMRTALEAAGIPSMIRSDDCGGQRPHMWMGGIELLVRADDVAQATEILDVAAVPIADSEADE